MKDLNTIRNLLEDIKTNGIHIGLPITKEECVDLQVVIEEYLNHRNLFWQSKYYGIAQMLRNSSNLIFAEVCKTNPSWREPIKKYYAWRLKLDSVSNAEASYFDTKQEAIDWVADFYKSNGYTISAGEQKKC